MNRFLSTLKNDFRLLSRHNLVSAAIFITILWVIMLYLIVLYESMTTAFMIPLLLFEDTATIGFFFMAGLILFEKDQGVLQGIATTPQKPAEYITSKVLSLSLLSVVSGMIYAIAGVVMNRIFLPNSSGIPLLWASLGLLMISVFYCFIGYASVSKFQNVNKYILVGSLYFLVLNVPLLGFFGVVDGWWLYLFPTQPYLLLMMTTNRLVPLEMWQYVYSISYGLVCIIVAWYFARRAYRMNMEWTGEEMRKLQALLAMDIKTIWRENFIVIGLCLPFLFAVLLRYIVPFIESRIGLVHALSGYYPSMIGLFVLVMPPFMIGLAGAFLMLDDYDQGALRAISVTPVSVPYYITYRLGLLAVLAFFATLISIPLTGLIEFKISILPLVLMTSMFVPLLALFIADFANNKVEGFAVMKASGFFLMAPMAANFIDSAWKYAFGIFPTFWSTHGFVLAVDGDPLVWVYIIIGFAVQGLTLLLLVKKFERKFQIV